MNQLIFLNPVLKHNIWGGTRLREEFGYQVEGDDIGECWGIAAHPSGDCTVKGASLTEKNCLHYGENSRNSLAERLGKPSRCLSKLSMPRMI